MREVTCARGAVRATKMEMDVLVGVEGGKRG